MAERPGSYEFGPFRLDLAEHALYRDGTEVPLTPKLFDLLRILIEAGGQLVTKEHLVATVWPDTAVEEGSLTRSVSRLRRVLDDQSGDEAFIKTVARKGYRFVAPVREIADEPISAPSPHPEPMPSDPVLPGADSTEATPSGRKRPRRMAWMMAAAVAAGLAGAWLRQREPEPAAPLQRPRSLAILPFESLDKDPDGLALGLGLADSLITRLANQSGVTVRPTSAVSRLAGTSPDSLTAGRALDVDVVLEGTVRRADGRHRVTARLIDVRNGSPVWGRTFDQTSASLLEVEDGLTQQIAGALKVALEPTALAAGGAAGTASGDAYEAYLRGRFLTFRLTEDSFASARGHLDRAIAIDPGFARAYAALSWLHINTADLVVPPRVAFSAARQAVERALVLDPNLAEAHATLGLIHWQHDWAFPEAERALRRAVELEPGNGFARSQYAFFLGSMGRAEESVAESERARALEPLSFDAGVTNAVTFYWARRHGEAADRAARVRSLDPGHWLPAVVSGRVLQALGSFDEAVAVQEKAARLDGALPEALMDLGRAYAAAGRRKDAHRTLAELRAFGKRRYAAPFQAAVILAALGEKDRAFQELGKAVAARSWYVTWLLVDPALDPLRSDPRFPVLLREVGLPPPSGRPAAPSPPPGGGS